MTSKPSVCFIAPYAFGELSRTDNGHAGGIERQQVLMAKHLHQRGFQTSLITWDEGQPDGVLIDGVRVLTLCHNSSGFPLLRFIHPRWTSLWGAMRRADADVYYYNLGDLGLGQAVAWARRHKRACVYSVSSEPSCEPELPDLKPLRERILYRYGLQRVDRIIVQTHRQQQLLRDGFGRDSVVIRMPGAEFPHASARSRPPIHNGHVRVLWVGRFGHPKRLEWLVEMARLRPTWTFEVVGAANAGDATAKAAEASGRLLPNVAFLGRLTRQELIGPYSSAHVLCNTSHFEGFPNTFLEAWSLGVPVATTFDPDGVVATYGLGSVADSPEGLAQAIETMTKNRSDYQAMSDRCKRYFREYHALDTVLPQFERVLQEAARSREAV